MCRAAGIRSPADTIDSVEPIYGLVVLGLVHPDRGRRKRRRQAGDALILGKPIGVGVLSAALKKGVALAGLRRAPRSDPTILTPRHGLAG